MIKKFVSGLKGSCAVFVVNKAGIGKWYVHQERQILDDQDGDEYAYVFNDNLRDISNDTPVFGRLLDEGSTDEVEENIREEIKHHYLIEDFYSYTKGELLDLSKEMLKSINEYFADDTDSKKIEVNQDNIYEFADRILQTTTWQDLSTIANDVLFNDIVDNPECYSYFFEYFL